MLSFHNNVNIKEKYLNRLIKHRELDNIIQGICWEGGKGCAVACTLENYDHAQYEIELGIPIWLAYVQDKLFEGLSKKYAKHFAVSFLQCIPVGVDLEKVKSPFLIFVLELGLCKLDNILFNYCKEAVINVIDLYKSGKIYDSEDCEAAYTQASAACITANVAAYEANNNHHNHDNISFSNDYTAAKNASFISEAAAYAAYASNSNNHNTSCAVFYAAIDYHDWDVSEKLCKIFSDKLLELFLTIEFNG